jgi:UDP-3-O-[3-hydroxymyristoyl] N-acetylglucosamine deacetylase
MDLVLQAGLKAQRRKRTYLRILREVEVRDGNKCIAAYPSSGYSVAYNIDFAQPIGKQSFEIDLAGGLYRSEVAAARTFGFLREEQAMRNMGLIRGASEENVIVVTDDGVRNGPLRFTDEFVRHKVLDLIGDLALLGKQIIGRIVADRAGHAMHTALVSRLLRDRSLWEETTEVAGDQDSSESFSVPVQAMRES